MTMRLAGPSVDHGSNDNLEASGDLPAASGSTWQRSGSTWISKPSGGVPRVSGNTWQHMALPWRSEAPRTAPGGSEAVGGGRAVARSFQMINRRSYESTMVLTHLW